MYHRTCYKQTKINLKQIKKVFYISVEKGFSTAPFLIALYVERKNNLLLIKVKINPVAKESTSQWSC